MFKKYIYIIILNALLLPAVLFAIFEFSALSDNENVIQQVYSNQLETIVFSVNQYTDDILSSWSEKISFYITEYNKLNDSLSVYLGRKPGLQEVYYVKDKKIEALLNTSNDGKKLYINKLINDSVQLLRKNKMYLNVNYRKNEPIGISNNEKLIYIAFWTGSSPESAQLCIMEIDVSKFISGVVVTRLQTNIIKEFQVAVFNKKSSDHAVYLSDTSKINRNFNFRKNLWLFPNYEISVQIKAKTIEDVIHSRLWTNIILFIIIELLFLGAAVLIFRFTRKEMRLARLKSEFISNVSHEIRTPLALISMYIETLDMGRIKSEEKIKEYYQVILQETQRLSGIVNNILNFSRLESGKTTFNFEPVPVSSLIDEVLATYRFHLKNKGFELHTQLDAQAELINIDKRSMCDVLVNLLDNAVKYSAEKKEITIRTSVEQNWLSIEVSDKGIGISKENLKLIFDQFFRVTQGNLALHAKGTGLGLSIVKFVVDAHKGKIEVDSIEGEGSTFRLMLPVCN